MSEHASPEEFRHEVAISPSSNGKGDILPLVEPPTALALAPTAEGPTENVPPIKGLTAEVVFSETALTDCPTPEMMREIFADDPRVILDDSKKMAVLFYIGLGASRRMAARQVGCCHRTIARAAVRDAAFAAELARAESQADGKCLQNIGRAADQEKHWRAAAWVLERRNPEEYGRRDPYTYSADRVMEIFTRYLHTVLPSLPAIHRETLLNAYDDVVGELAKDPNALPNRDKLKVKEPEKAKDVPPSPVTAPPPPPPPELQCPREEAAARAWIQGLSEAESNRVWDRARIMPDTPDWNHWRKLLREESDKMYRQKMKARKERKRLRSLEAGNGRVQ
jgi:hypothetical protein